MRRKVSRDRGGTSSPNLPRDIRTTHPISSKLLPPYTPADVGLDPSTALRRTTTPNHGALQHRATPLTARHAPAVPPRPSWLAVPPCTDQCRVVAPLLACPLRPLPSSMVATPRCPKGCPLPPRLISMFAVPQGSSYLTSAKMDGCYAAIPLPDLPLTCAREALGGVVLMAILVDHGLDGPKRGLLRCHVLPRHAGRPGGAGLCDVHGRAPRLRRHHVTPPSQLCSPRGG